MYDLQANKKTRNRAYEIIVQIGHACVDEDNGGNKENLYNFFNMVKNLPDNNTLVCGSYVEVILIPVPKFWCMWLVVLLGRPLI